MTDPTLPASVLRAMRMASVAPHIKATFAQLPQPLRIDAELPLDLAGVPAGAFQLLKLAHVGPRVRLGSLVIGGTTLRIVVSRGEERCELGAAELGRDLRDLTRTILGALFERSDVARILESFAFRSSSLTTLQRITNHMLQATDVDEALYVMLSGLTSGQGLSFNRAALFTPDEERGTFVGSKAIGPADLAEAHRIWEEIELEDMSIEQLIDDFSNGRFDTRFQQLVREVELTVGPGPDDELARALASAAPLCLKGPVVNASLARFGVASEYVLAAIKPHKKVLGFVVADSLYSGQGVSDEQLTCSAFFIDQTALVWENLTLLRRVEALARYDALTGVFNRREFDARFEIERSRCQRSGTSCSVMVLDVDRFKETNDVSGHAAGDAVLRSLGAILRSETREHDIVARLGGDEFVVLLPHATREQNVVAIRRVGTRAKDAGISLSIGGASWPGDCPEMSALLTTADAELYKAKRAGRGCASIGDAGSFAFDPSSA